MEYYTQILRQLGAVMTVAGVIFGIILAFIVFFVFMAKRNENRFHGFLGWLYEYLNFKNFIIEGLLKFLYVLAACICTVVGAFNILCLQFLVGFGALILGNLVLRIAYELILMLVLICRNVTEINKKLGGSVEEKSLFRECPVPPMPKKEDFVKHMAPDSSVFREDEAKKESAVAVEPVKELAVAAEVNENDRKSLEEVTDIKE